MLLNKRLFLSLLYSWGLIIPTGIPLLYQQLTVGFNILGVIALIISMIIGTSCTYIWYYINLNPEHKFGIDID